MVAITTVSKAAIGTTAKAVASRSRMIVV